MSLTVDFSHSPLAHSYEIHMHQTVTSTTARVASLCPELLLGSHALFQWDQDKCQIALSSPFQALLNLLMKLNTLKPDHDIHSLEELNALLQKPQGEGGLLRQPGKERWEIEGQPVWRERKEELNALLVQLGFVEPRILSEQVEADWAVVPGGRAERMDFRVRETLKLLDELVEAEKVALLGSTRQLIGDEKLFLEGKIMTTHAEGKWKARLDQCTSEKDALSLLWDYTANEEKHRSSILVLESQRIGASYGQTEGVRPTTDITTDDLASYYQEGVPQSFFILTEQPYIRIMDQLRDSILTHARKASVDQIVQRVASTRFYFVSPRPQAEPSLEVVLDEIARNVYRTLSLLRYLEQQEKNIH